MSNIDFGFPQQHTASVSVSIPSTARLALGATLQLVPVVQYAFSDGSAAPAFTLQYQSNCPAVASIDANGLIAASSVGSYLITDPVNVGGGYVTGGYAVITASVVIGGGQVASAECLVTVVGTGARPFTLHHCRILSEVW